MHNILSRIEVCLIMSFKMNRVHKGLHENIISHAGGGQRTIFRNQFSPSTVWVPGLDSGRQFDDKNPSLPRHLASSPKPLT